MERLPLYLQLGFEHISNLAGYDHILFLVALCAVYQLRQWRHIVILVTAFTLGHSITLALAAFGTIIIPSAIVEFLIPTTILLTALFNVFSRQPTAEKSARMGRHYLMALFFGFIHGMGFSNYFRALMMSDDSIVIPLLGFNVGIELGQLAVVLVILGLSFLFQNVIGVKHRDWNVFISGAAAGLAVNLMVETRFW
ncbi:MAG: HupE/UreJ family protein [Pseudomonadota bacterium]